MSTLASTSAGLCLDARHDVRRTLSVHRVGNDPTTLIAAGEFWRSSLTPAGAVTVHLTWDTAQAVVRVWGPGGDWALQRAGDLLEIGRAHV